MKTQLNVYTHEMNADDLIVIDYGRFQGFERCASCAASTDAPKFCGEKRASTTGKDAKPFAEYIAPADGGHDEPVTRFAAQVKAVVYL